MDLKVAWLTDRRRVTRLFTYENVTEILARGLTAEFRLPRHRANEGRLAVPLSQLQRGLEGLSGEPGTDSPSHDGEEVVDSDTLSRVSVEGLALRLTPEGHHTITVAAHTAEISGEFKTVLLTGQVDIAGDRCRIAAPTAIWSADFEGFAFPVGCVIGGQRRPAGTFVTLDARGACERVRPAPTVVHADPLLEREAALYQRISASMPAYARFMLGVGLPQPIARPGER